MRQMMYYYIVMYNTEEMSNYRVWMSLHRLLFRAFVPSLFRAVGGRSWVSDYGLAPSVPDEGHVIM